MPNLGPLSYVLDTGDRGTRDFYVDFTDQLASSELLSTVPAITASESEVTISEIAVNSSIITDGRRTVAIGKGVQFRATMTADYTGGTIDLQIHYHTDDSNIDTAKVSLAVVETLT